MLILVPIHGPVEHSEHLVCRTGQFPFSATRLDIQHLPRPLTHTHTQRQLLYLGLAVPLVELDADAAEALRPVVLMDRPNP
jgi:hypothetical protein